MISVKAILVLKLRVSVREGKAAVLTREWTMPAAPRKGDRIYCPYLEADTDEEGVGGEVVLVRWDMPRREDDTAEVFIYLLGNTYHEEGEWLEDVGVWKRAGFDCEFGDLNE